MGWDLIVHSMSTYTGNLDPLDGISCQSHNIQAPMGGRVLNQSPALLKTIAAGSLEMTIQYPLTRNVS